MSRPFEDLWADYLEGELDESGIAELNALLTGNDELLRLAADLYEEHRLLGLAFQPFDSGRFVESVTSAAASDRDLFVDNVLNGIGPGTDARAAKHKASHTGMPHQRGDRPHGTHWLERRTGNAMVLVSGIVLSLMATFIWSRSDHYENPDGLQSVAAPLTRSIATLLLAENCVWRGVNDPDEGQRLASQSLELKSGLAVIRFDGGAELVMSGDTAVELLSSGRADLQFGEVVVRAEDGADGFELGTPASPIVDLGTEFAARVDRRGATEVHVIDGQVEYTSGELRAVLSAGKAIRLKKDVGIVQNGTWNSRSFDEILRQANPKPQPHRMTAYEGFHYGPGVLPLHETTKGIGWTGPWRLRSPEERKVPATEESPESFEVVHGQMNVTWPVPGGRLGMLKLHAGNAYYVRPMKKSIDLDRDGVMYFSLMVRELERVIQEKRPRERVRVTFRSLSDYFSEYISFGHGSGFQPQVRTGDGLLHVSPLVMPAEQTTLWIGKIAARATGEDEIYFRVYGEEDVLGYAEPATWHVVTRGVELKSHFDCVLLSSEGTTSRIIDELRIGPTWRSVAPMLEEE